MILLNIELDNIYCFKNTEIKLAHWKRIKNPLLGEEFLEGRTRFKYNTVSIMVGSNATGKTTLGMALDRAFRFLNTREAECLFDMVNGDTGYITFDFIVRDYDLHSVKLIIKPEIKTVKIEYGKVYLKTTHSYDLVKPIIERKSASFAELEFGRLHAMIIYPGADIQFEVSPKEVLPYVDSIVHAMDPALTAINEDEEIYIVRGNDKFLVANGAVSGLTDAIQNGVKTAYYLAQMKKKKHHFYYIDECNRGIQSNIEQAILHKMIEYITPYEQLIYTTYNDDMLCEEMPNHSFLIMKRDRADGTIKMMKASDTLLRKEDSIERAISLDRFESLPNTEQIKNL